jgi:hypothetical protein
MPETTTTTTRDGRWAAIVAEYEPRDAGERLVPGLRFGLIESSEINGERIGSVHETATAALAYNAEQEYAADWSIVLIVDLDTGEQVPESEWEKLYLDTTSALDRIAKHLSGREWSAADLEEVADIVRRTGRDIKDPDDVDPDEIRQP